MDYPISETVSSQLKPRLTILPNKEEFHRFLESEDE